MAAQYLLSNRMKRRVPPSQKPIRNEEHADPSLGQEVEAAAEEIQVGFVLAVRFVGVFGKRGTARPIGGIADDEPQLAANLGFVLSEPPLQRSFKHGYVRTHGGKELCRYVGKLHGSKVDRLKTRSRAGVDQAPNSGGRLQRLHQALLARQSG